jgi:hypothetical protein
MSIKNSATAKLTIIPLDAGSPVIAQYNPKELGVDKSVPWQKAATSTGDQPEMQFTAAEGRSMSFELFFDGYETETNVHAKPTSRRCCDGDGHRPQRARKTSAADAREDLCGALACRRSRA